MSVGFRVLGPLECWSDGVRHDIGSPHQQRFVAAMALNADALVSWARLAELVWDGTPPATARQQLNRAARALRKNCPDVVLTASDDGYRLSGADVDVRSFEAHIEQGRLREALALWRGPALAGTTGQGLAEIAAELDARRAEVWEESVGMELALDPHADVRSELVTMTETFPLRERPVELLMRVQQREEALDTYHRFRTRLLVKQSREPSSELRELHQAIQADRTEVPEQLPADVTHFVGRAGHLAALDPAGVTVISGVAGVGKTALAVRWANHVRDEFPDGQLYLNMRGYQSAQPVSADEALKTFLHALGTPPQRVPDTLAERAALLGSLLARRRVLIVLDNAATAEQVEPVLVAGGGCAVVITSRERLTSLPDVRRIHLDVLSRTEAHMLLVDLLGGHRVAAEPDAAGALAEACGHLPLTLRVVASELGGRPGHRIADAVTGLTRPSVNVALALSYDALPPAARDLLRYIACTPGPDVTEDGASALLGASAERALARLEAAHLVIRHLPGRYRLHDLVRKYAAARSGVKDSAALTRWLDHLIATADAAGRTLMPGFLRLPRPMSLAAPEFPDAPSASSWFTRERQNVMAAIVWAGETGFDDRCVHLVDAMRTGFWLTQDTADWIRAARSGLAAAERGGERDLRAAMHCNLALGLFGQGRAEDSIEHNMLALELFEQVDDWSGTVTALINVAIGHTVSGRPALAAELQECAFAIGVRHDCLDTQAIALLGLWTSQQDMGLAHAADDTAERCIRLTEVAPDYRPGALDRLASTRLESGSLILAEQTFIEALEQYHAHQRRYLELYCISGLGRIGLYTGDIGRAEECFGLVREYAQEHGMTQLLAETLGGLAEARSHTNSHQARELAEQALNALRALAVVPHQIWVLAVLAHIHVALGNSAAAAAVADDAIAIAEQHGIGKYLGRALHARATVCLARREHDQAREWALRAIIQHRRTGQRLYEVQDLVLLAEVLRHTGDAPAADAREAEATRLCDEVAGPRAPDVLFAARTRGPHLPW